MRKTPDINFRSHMHTCTHTPVNTHTHTAHTSTQKKTKALRAGKFGKNGTHQTQRILWLMTQHWACLHGGGGGQQGRRIQMSLAVVLHVVSVEPTQRTLASEHREADFSPDRERLCSKKLRHNIKPKHVYMSRYWLPSVWPSAYAMTYSWGLSSTR